MAQVTIAVLQHNLLRRLRTLSRRTRAGGLEPAMTALIWSDEHAGEEAAPGADQAAISAISSRPLVRPRGRPAHRRGSWPRSYSAVRRRPPIFRSCRSGCRDLARCAATSGRSWPHSSLSFPAPWEIYSCVSCSVFLEGSRGSPEMDGEWGRNRQQIVSYRDIRPPPGPTPPARPASLQIGRIEPTVGKLSVKTSRHGPADSALPVGNARDFHTAASRDCDIPATGRQDNALVRPSMPWKCRILLGNWDGQARVGETGDGARQEA